MDKNKKLNQNQTPKKEDKKRRKFIFWWWFGGGLATLSLLVTAAFSLPTNNNPSSTISSSSINTSISSSVVNSSISSSSTSMVELLAIEVEKLPTKTTYLSTEVVTTSGGTLRVVYSDYSVKYVPMNDSMIDTSRLNLSVIGNTSVTIRYQDKGITKFISYPIKVIPFVINPTKVSIDITSSDVLFDQQVNLNYLVEPLNASYTSVIWSSSDETIATVSKDGVVTPRNQGVVVITVTVDGKYSGTTTLNVLPRITPVVEQPAQGGGGTPSDTTAPTATSLTITSSNITSTGVTLTWTKATDDVTTGANLRYFVYRSLSSINLGNYNSATLINAGGSLDIGTINVTGLTAATAYNFNVIVKDGASNELAYTNVTVTTNSLSQNISTYNNPIPIANVMDLDMIDGTLNSKYWNGTSFAVPSTPTSYTFASGTQDAITFNIDNAGAFLQKHYFLVNNIDFKNTSNLLYENNNWSDQGFYPIGGTFNSTFSGILDGDNYSLLNVYINITPNQYLGLFRTIGNGAEIKDLKIENANYTLGLNGNISISGSLSGRALGGNTLQTRVKISNVKVNADLTTFGSTNGGLIGRAENTDIEYSSFSGLLTGNGSVIGGIVGQSINSNIKYSYVKNLRISSSSDKVGGLVGSLQSSSLLTESYAEVALSGTSYIGGLVGELESSNVNNSYAIGSISNGDNVGGLIGATFNTSTVNNNYSTVDIAGTGIARGLLIGTATGTLTFTRNATLSNSSFNNNLILIANGTASVSNNNTTISLISDFRNVTTFANLTWDFLGESTNGNNDYWSIESTKNNGYPIISKLTNTYNLTYSTSLLVELNALSYKGSGPIIDSASYKHMAEVFGPTFNGATNTFTFDGTNDYLSIADDSGYEFGTGSFTLEVWINPLIPNSTAVIFGKFDADNGTNTSYGLRLQANRSLFFELGPTAGTSAVSLTIPNAITFEIWNHIVVVFDNPSNKIFIYVNGIELGNTNFTDDGVYNATVPLIIGDFKSGGSLTSANQFYKGKMGLIRLYNSNLDTSQIMTNYNSLKDFYK